ncbi:MAG TPA: allantoicase [Bacteroidetes bacterium]|nr:allantoicase [Bacteroidota bacterium]
MQEPTFTSLTDLAAERLGGKVLYTTDDFFAEKENLIKPGRGIFIPDKYTDRGKWMDGWESRRKRTPGHDFCIIQLAVPGKIKGFDIDTNHFLGNHPPFASVEAAVLKNEPSEADIKSENIKWTEVLPKSPLNPGSQHFFEINSDNIWTHLKLNIYPDGGVARFRAYGEVFKQFKKGEIIDLAAAINGGKALQCNDMFFSKMDNLIMPGRGLNMGDGWETKRNRTPNNRDWVIIKLATAGHIKKVLLDTCHFKGNYPDKFSLEGCFFNEENKFDAEKINWTVILPPTKLQADCEHFFIEEIKNAGPFTHVRLNIFPDGGVSRLRVFGSTAFTLSR